VLVGRGGSSSSGLSLESPRQGGGQPRARRCALQQVQALSDADAEAWLAEADRQRSDWIRRHYGADWEDPAYYDLIVAQIVWAWTGGRVDLPRCEPPGILGHQAEIGAWIERHGVDGSTDRATGAHGFVHPARPSSPACWTSTGSAGTTSRSHSRWLGTRPTCRRGLHTGLLSARPRPLSRATTLKQSLVTDKNRKIRKFRELYPTYSSRSSTGGTSAASCRSTACPRRRPGLERSVVVPMKGGRDERR